ncbi:hypothetical protein [Nocardioides sp.]|uniref:hypothetical protein n=1 Tax=Nocardioides sp. TaxID=35761 RepID=UPI002CAF67B3|nr:hypothetical protein [Nocardioides sp.]HSX68064.1 hypothetical protein [Nocardioides sp.]
MSTFTPRLPFSRRAALAAGIRVVELEGPRFRRLHTGVYVEATAPDSPTLRALAALVPFPEGTVVSHATAGRLYGVPLPPLAGEHVTVSQREARRMRGDIACHLRRSTGVRQVHGVRTVSPEQLFVDLSTQLSLVDLVIVGDHLVRRKQSTLARLRTAALAARGPGARLARTAAALVRERVDSPMETKLRLLLVFAGLPEPVVNMTWSSDGGLTFRRFDLCWPGVRLIFEYDGRHHVEVVDQWEADLSRREEIDDAEWRIVVVTSDGVHKHPDQTVAKAHRLLRKYGQPGTPRRTSDGWRAHFPGRN